MTEKQRVCVTGAGGYIGSWLIKYLLSRGYIVHGTVRDPGDEKNAHLKKLENAAENLILFKTDLFDLEGLCSAIAGCTGVFHVASFVPAFHDTVAEEEVTEPAITGTKNVMKACAAAKVKRVVVVSSIAAVVCNPKWHKDHPMDEECWSDPEFIRTLEGDFRYYLLAKTLAEREALEYNNKGNEFEVVTVCPSITIGPRLQSTINASSSLLLNLLKGSAESVEDATYHLVDVRDVAEALVLVYKNPEAKGRYICNSYTLKISALVEKMKSMYPRPNYPKRFTEAEEAPQKGDRMLSSEKLKRLGWNYKTLEETIVDSVICFEKTGDLPKPEAAAS
ncbi:PREDICTED: cinnamoyl-CoA reductase 2 [Tarenaya hassleriana]|uniref:cinnamoyl-CoA reductase 2 n=1 Tax=Tarenaya hassleriana TaxID=28532 RepID=UPI00053C7DEF|nr:PREDICTED: cinnamoyl-CoA reductase 2 [Tarenaya hassleriana]XP_010537242.1 PREDICTED: cinnamoyl-CoA reductase 2 [Tarenaya hassleriana]XP_019058015.1 PREDICTED: cinnamoyl-CoA reductase 2 [Tarenaya hassleriana]